MRDNRVMVLPVPVGICRHSTGLLRTCICRHSTGLLRTCQCLQAHAECVSSLPHCKAGGSIACSHGWHAPQPGEASQVSAVHCDFEAAKAVRKQQALISCLSPMCLALQLYLQESMAFGVQRTLAFKHILILLWVYVLIWEEYRQTLQAELHCNLCAPVGPRISHM